MRAALAAATLLAGCGLVYDFDPRPDASTQLDAHVRVDGQTGCTEGTACPGATNVPSVCIAGQCVAGRCGDGVVDPRSEDCEGDDRGCVSCHFACRADSDCGGPLPECVTALSCDSSTHSCVATPAHDGTPCNTGHCASAACVPDTCGDGIPNGSEQCDDGNTVADDGCDPSCQFSCDSDLACLDGDMCNGNESCGAGGTGHICLPGMLPPPITGCEYCDPSIGLVIPDADGDGYPGDGDGLVADPTSCPDCNDHDPNIHPGAPDRCDGIDNDCNGTVDDGTVTVLLCYPDLDGDGFPATLSASEATRVDCSACSTTTLCVCPAGTVPLPTTSGGAPLFDCWDNSVDVHPGQSMYFDIPYCMAGTASCTHPFDYNCDGIEEQEDTAVNLNCPLLLSRCSATGWAASPPPACGATAMWRTCNGLLSPVACTNQVGPRNQSCR